LDQAIGGGTEYDTVGRGEFLQPGGDVRGLADDGQGFPRVAASHLACDDQPCVNTDPYL